MCRAYLNDIAFFCMIMNARGSHQNHLRPREMLSHAAEASGTRETVPRTCDQTINDRVEIDFRVSHKNSPEQNRSGNRVRVLLRSAAAASSVV